MRYGPLLIAAFAFSGCLGRDTLRTPANEYVLTGPEPSRPMPPIPALPSARVDASAKATGWLWVMVIDGSGPCIDGAVIEIVSGQGKGLKGTPMGNCDVWDFEGGYFIYGLVPGQSLTIRASAPEYQDSEMTFLPSSAESPQVSIITLSTLYGQPSISRGEPTLDFSH